MDSPANPLDSRLPLLQPRQTELHQHVDTLEVADRALLVELASNPRIRRYLLARLSDTVALIDPGQTEALAKVLRSEGHTPRMLKKGSE